jgi:hypothetical protein
MLPMIPNLPLPGVAPIGGVSTPVPLSVDTGVILLVAGATLVTLSAGLIPGLRRRLRTVRIHLRPAARRTRAAA